MSFSVREVRLIELLADLSDKRSKQEKAREAGFHPKSVFRLLKREDFRQAIVERVRANLDVDLTKVYRMLVDLAVNEKSVKAAELLLKASGHIQQGGQVNVTNVRQDGGGHDDRSFADRLREDFEDRKRHANFPGRGNLGPLDVDEEG